MTRNRGNRTRLGVDSGKNVSPFSCHSQYSVTGYLNVMYEEQVASSSNASELHSGRVWYESAKTPTILLLPVVLLSTSIIGAVSIVTSYGLDAEGKDFSPLHVVQTGSGAHVASYPMGTGDSFPGGKAAGA
jgi:hypothetical protein